MNFSAILNLAGLHPGAHPNDVSSVEQQLGIQLPNDYIQFLMFSNGGLLGNGLSFYPLGDLIERNQTYEIIEYTPGYLLVGDDSGGLGILLSLEPSDKRIYASGLGDLSATEFKVVAPSLQVWVDVRFSV